MSPLSFIAAIRLRIVAGALLGLQAGLGAHLYADSPTYPVRWTDRLPIKPGEDIMAKLNEPVDMGSPGNLLEVPSNNEAGEFYRKPVITGLDYLREVADGYYPSAMGNYDRAMAGFFIRAVEPLVLVHCARPSYTSFVGNVTGDTITLEELPAHINQFRESSSGHGLSFYDECNNYVIVSRSANSLEWECHSTYGTDDVSRWFYSLEFVVWGDFNHDGYEDVLGYFYMSYLTGSNRDNYMVVLTRKQDSGMLEYLGTGDEFIGKFIKSGCFTFGEDDGTD